jgi:hypothetical protein
MNTITMPHSNAQAPARTGGWLMPVLVILATVVTLAVNALANTLPINGQTTGDVSDSFQVFFVPAAYVFSIWGVIYVGLIGYTIYQARPRFRNDGLLREIAPWYLATAAANSAWIFAWHYNQFPLSMGLMLVLLVSLIVIYRRLARQAPASWQELWAVHIPFRIYLGWISVATIANATVVLDNAGWNGFGLSELTWGTYMVVVAGALGLLFSLLRADVAYVLVFVWALAGIAVRFSDVPAMLFTAGGFAALLALSLLVAVARRTRQAKRTPARA